MELSSELCFRLARRMVLRRDSAGERQAGSGAQVFDRDAYRSWREQELRGQFTEYFSADDVRGKHVVDFGCGEGDLSFVMAHLGVASITGVELSERQYRSAAARAEQGTWPVQPKFVLGRRTDMVELPTDSVDVLLCFDVLEHIMDYRSVVADWRRVLRPGGRVLIWWVPWGHPYGPHIESLVPIPWCHVLFSEHTLLSTCARVYDMPEFQPRIWDLDENGNKKPNKWTNMQALPEVNKLTMAEFEHLCGEAGLSIRSKRQRGFGSSGLAKLTHGFLRVPRLREYFTSSVVYDLVNKG